MFEITRNLKQRFCKDMGISIQLFEEPYFKDRIELMGYKDVYKEFTVFIENNFASEEDYFAYYNELKNKMIDYIKNSEVYEMIQKDSSFNKTGTFKQGDTYKDENIGKSFLSIDMVKANFSALVFYGQCFDYKFFDSYNYDNFVKQFTPYDYFAKSKYIRQVVFGNCNPKKQIAFETYLMSTVVSLLKIPDLITENQIYSLNSDEIILEVDKETADKITKHIEKGSFAFPLKTEYYTVAKLEGTKAYVKMHEDGSYELKCVNSYEAPFIYRFMKKESIKEIDKYFLYEDKLSKFVDIPEINLITEKVNNDKEEDIDIER